MSLYLLGTDPPGQPEGAPWLGAPAEATGDLERWSLHCLHSLLSAWMEPLWVPLEWLGLAPLFSQGRLIQLLPFHHPCCSMQPCELLEELTCAASQCGTVPHIPWPGVCSSTLDDPVGTGPRRRGRRGPSVRELSAGSILEQLSYHCHTCSEDPALAGAVTVTGTPRWWPMAGRPHGITLRREERVESRGEDGKVLPPVAHGAWLRCGSLLPCFPLSLSLRALPGTVEREERAGGRASSRHELREDQRSRARSLPLRTGAFWSPLEGREYQRCCCRVPPCRDRRCPRVSALCPEGRGRWTASGVVHREAEVAGPPVRSPALGLASEMIDQVAQGFVQLCICSAPSMVDVVTPLSFQDLGSYRRAWPKSDPNRPKPNTAWACVSQVDAPKTQVHPRA